VSLFQKSKRIIKMENESQWYDEIQKLMETIDLLGDENDPNYYCDDTLANEGETIVDYSDYSLEANDGNF
jgi:hypothetical protein